MLLILGVLGEDSDSTPIKCICEKLLEKRTVKSHVISFHQDLNLKVFYADVRKHFNPSSHKCTYCDFTDENLLMKKFHLYSKHKSHITIPTNRGKIIIVRTKIKV